ncbi:MAG: glycosyltransferase family 2 protein [Crocinitomicaceae bacterium]
MKSPLLSVITVTYNNFSGLKQTVENINQLTYKNFEHIIIDGDSSDETKNYLNSLDYENLTWISKKDNGIYDAMNKGIKQSIGEWIIFMNAGDEFSTNTVLQNIEFREEKKVIYGDCDVLYNTDYSRIMKALSLNQIWKGLPFSHQSVFTHRSILKEGFNLSYKYCADFELFLKNYTKENQWHYCSFSISKITAGGVSDNKRYLATNEVYQINRKMNNSIKIHFYFIPKIILSFFIVKLKSVLPTKLTNIVYKIKY